MTYWLREIAGWLLVLTGLFVFLQAYGLLVNKRVFEAGPTVVIGFVVFRPTGDSDALPATGEIDAFYTNPKIWGVGAGQALMDDALARLKQAGFSRATLWTEERNHRPRRFYELWGWHTDGTTRTREVRGTEINELRYWIGL